MTRCSRGCCQAGEASGCLVELPPARLGIKTCIPGPDFRARCLRQIVSPQLKFFFIGKSRFDLSFLAAGSALRRRFFSGQIMAAMASLSGLQKLNMETRAVHPYLLTSRFRSRWSKRALRLAH